MKMPQNGHKQEFNSHISLKKWEGYFHVLERI